MGGGGRLPTVNKVRRGSAIDGKDQANVTPKRALFDAAPLRPAPWQSRHLGHATLPDCQNTLPRAPSGAPSLQPRSAGFPLPPLLFPGR
jgi:hypothetical protein